MSQDDTFTEDVYESPKKVLQDKFILDATAGFRMMWFNKQHPNCIYLDQRPECEPDIVGDFRDLKQFPDETFRLIVFDPPHMKRPAGNNATGLITKTFGALTSETWQVDIRRAFQELWRILQPYGLLIFKWNDHNINIAKIKPFFPSVPLFSQETKGSTRCPYQQVCKAKLRSKSRASITQWFCFMKIENEKKLEAEQ